MKSRIAFSKYELHITEIVGRYDKENPASGNMMRKIGWREEVLAKMNEIYEYDEVLHEIPEKGGAYIIFPWNVREEFGKGRVKVHVTFDGVPYDGSIVNMGVKNADGEVCYIIGVLKSIRTQLKKGEGDTIHVVVKLR